MVRPDQRDHDTAWQCRDASDHVRLWCIEVGARRRGALLWKSQGPPGRGDDGMETLKPKAV